jgi:hypothetical protein
VVSTLDCDSEGVSSILTIHPIKNFICAFGGMVDTLALEANEEIHEGSSPLGRIIKIINFIVGERRSWRAEADCKSVA